MLFPFLCLISCLLAQFSLCSDERRLPCVDQARWNLPQKILHWVTILLNQKKTLIWENGQYRHNGRMKNNLSRYLNSGRETQAIDDEADQFPSKHLLSIDEAIVSVRRCIQDRAPLRLGG